MVIQRWQSVLLLVAAVVMGIFSFMPVAGIALEGVQMNFLPLGFLNAGIPTDGSATGYDPSTWWYFVMSILGAAVPLADIFCYRNLGLQKNLCVLAIVIQLAVMVCGGMLVYHYADGGMLVYHYADGGNVEWNQMCCAPVIAIVACVMAWRRINKDKNLLESADRLR